MNAILNPELILSAVARDIEFSINIGELVQVQAERYSCRELTEKDNKLFGRELVFRPSVIRSRLNTKAMSAEELATAREIERGVRAELLAEHYANTVWPDDDDEDSDGPDLCSVLPTPDFIDPPNLLYPSM